MEIFFLFILGLLVGSFLNVVIFRIEKGESFVFGRSHCQNCNHFLSWFENIPFLSFVFLRGKCRSCKKNLSWQYPLVEFITAVFFVSSTFFLGFYDEYQWIILGIFLVMVSFAVLILIYDFRFQLIPTSFLWGLNISTFCFLLAHKVMSLQPIAYFPPSMYSSLWGGMVGGGFFFVLVYLSKETWMGWGDVWLGLWGGMLLGIELLQIFITGAFTLGALVGITLIIQKKKTLKAEVPFAPYILFSGFSIFVLLFLFPSLIQFLSPWLPGTI